VDATGLALAVERRARADGDGADPPHSSDISTGAHQPHISSHLLTSPPQTRLVEPATEDITQKSQNNTKSTFSLGGDDDGEHGDQPKRAAVRPRMRRRPVGFRV
jgi:hypothetical protein